MTAARAQADVVIVSLHDGAEYLTRVAKETEEFAHAAIDAGATAVFGHHPHVPQRVEQYKDGWIFYSLGNFVFQQNTPANVRHSLIARLAFEGKNLSRVEALPAYIENYARPRLGLDTEVVGTDVTAVLARQRELEVPQAIEWVHETTPSLLAAATEAGMTVERCPLLVLDGEPDVRPSPAEVRRIGGDDPVLILYTGGTTGDSKGALHSHKSLFMGMLNQTVAERIVPSDVYMLTGQMFHIPVALAINYMAHGCPLVLVNFEAKQALELIQEEKVSAFLGITTMLNWMMAVENFSSYDLRSLRNIQYGGGPMPPTVVQSALASFPCTLIQGYGQTEGMTMTFLSQEDHRDAIAGRHPERLASCGRQGFVTRVRLVDESGRTVPRDGATPGEIVVRSEANMLGYWRKPELSSPRPRLP